MIMVGDSRAEVCILPATTNDQQYNVTGPESATSKSNQFLVVLKNIIKISRV